MESSSTLADNSRRVMVGQTVVLGGHFQHPEQNEFAVARSTCQSFANANQSEVSKNEIDFLIA